MNSTQQIPHHSIEGSLLAIAGDMYQAQYANNICVYAHFFYHTDENNSDGSLSYEEHNDSIGENVVPADDEVWDIDEQAVLDDFHSESNLPQEKSTLRSVKWVLLFILLWSTFYSVSASAINHLLKFISYLLKWLSPMTTLSMSFPSSLYKVKKALGLQQDDFIKYVVCPQCHSLYAFNSCYEITGSRTVLKCCSKVQFPLHPHRSRRTQCNHSLVRKVILTNGSEKVYPLKVYSYKSVKESLYAMMCRPGILQQCEEWRSRKIPTNCMFDVYDGKVWSEFMVYKEKPFLAEKYNLALMVNVDWFQPFKFSEYSVGVIYLAILNLPRTMRYKIENILIVGIIPGPKEPSSLNTYMSPLVDELLDLWENGLSIEIGAQAANVRAALICAACDIPAARKLCGFLGHSSSHCPRCNIRFSYDKEYKKMDYSGITEYTSKSNSLHVQHAEATRLCHTQAKKEAYEHEHGSRYSELMRLPYFDCVRFTIIDPMHNLFLGTSKYILKNIWLSEDSPLISRKDMSAIQEIVDSTKLPSTIGRIPHKIESSFSSFTADQWKNWILYFSLVALHGVIPVEHLECWRCFVLACSLICSPKISRDVIDQSHALLMKFQEKYEAIYGKLRVTPNIHLHRHLKECLIDYGPVYGFWLFSFERFNGIIGSYHTNQKSIEIQLMRRFLSDLSVHTLCYTDLSIQQHKDLFNDFLDTNKSLLKGSLHQTIDFEMFSSAIADITLLFELPSMPLHPSQNYLLKLSIQCCGPYSRKIFDTDSLSYLTASYHQFLPSIDVSSIPMLFESFQELQLWGDRIGCNSSRLERCCCIKAIWTNGSGLIDTSMMDMRAGLIEFFFRQSVLIAGKYETVVMAAVKWFQSHPIRHKLGKPIELWIPDLFVPFGPSTFIPVTRISTQCCYGLIKIERETFMAVCPLNPKILM